MRSYRCCSVIGNSFIPDGGSGFSLENYEKIFTKLLYQKAIINSLKISLTSSLIGIVIAFLGAKAIHNHTGKLSTAFTTVLNMVSNFAGVPLAFSYMILLGNAGFMVHVGQKLGIQGLARLQSVYIRWNEHDLCVFPDSACDTASYSCI